MMTSRCRWLVVWLIVSASIASTSADGRVVRQTINDQPCCLGTLLGGRGGRTLLLTREALTPTAERLVVRQARGGSRFGPPRVVAGGLQTREVDAAVSRKGRMAVVWTSEPYGAVGAALASRGGAYRTQTLDGGSAENVLVLSLGGSMAAFWTPDPDAPKPHIVMAVARPGRPFGRARPIVGNGYAAGVLGMRGGRFALVWSAWSGAPGNMALHAGRGSLHGPVVALSVLTGNFFLDHPVFAFDALGPLVTANFGVFVRSRPLADFGQRQQVPGTNFADTPTAIAATSHGATIMGSARMLPNKGKVIFGYSTAAPGHPFTKLRHFLTRAFCYGEGLTDEIFNVAIDESGRTAGLAVSRCSRVYAATGSRNGLGRPRPLGRIAPMNGDLSEYAAGPAIDDHGNVTFAWESPRGAIVERVIHR